MLLNRIGVTILVFVFYSFRFCTQCYKLKTESVLVPNNAVTVCYVSTWAVYRVEEGKFGIENLDPSLCTHLVYAFAGLNESTSTIKSLDPFNDLEEDYGKGTYKKMTSLKSQYPGLKVTLAIGGWNEGSQKYSDLAASPSKRKTFVESVVVFLKKFNFDGLDLDWEYPGKRKGKPEDKTNFITLIKELRTEMDKNGWILTAALGAAKDTIDTGYDLPALNKYLDFLHLMCYDYHGSWDLKVGANAPLMSTQINDYLTVEYSVKYLLENGVSPKKLVLGLPFYGRTFILKELGSNETESAGFQGPFTKEDGFYGYNEICYELKENNALWEQWWDEGTKTAFAKNEKKVISFDNGRSLKEKVKLAASYGLAGVMIWSIDTDDFHGRCNEVNDDDPNSPTTFPLLRMIRSSLNKFYTEQIQGDTKDHGQEDENNFVDPNGSSKQELSLLAVVLMCLVFSHSIHQQV